MTIDLSMLAFTNDADILPLLGIEKIINSGNVHTLGGNDVLNGNALRAEDIAGFENHGTIDTDCGDDAITGFENNAGIASYGIYNTGTIYMGAGNDSITANISGRQVGIGNSGKLDMGAGNDTITVSSISNVGKIETGTGNDTITITGYNFGLSNYSNGIIDTGSGDDIIFSSSVFGKSIDNAGKIDAGNGNDTITGSSSVYGLYGIYNTGTIDLGDGHDVITGTSTATSGAGIYNDGTIKTGAGKDIVNALTGGFGGNGNINLGDGNDAIEGFGTGHFDGGNGQDTLIFGTGTYTVAASTNLEGFYTISNGITDMHVSNFESIGSNADPTHLMSFAALIGHGSFVIA